MVGDGSFMRLKCVAGGEVEKRWGKGRGGVGVGVTSALATVQRKSKAKKMNVFLSFLQISL